MICSGDRRTNGWGERSRRHRPPPPSIWRQTAKGKGGRRGAGGGLWQKRGKLKRIIIIRRWRGCGKGPHSFRSNQVITLHLLIEPRSAKTSRAEEKWGGMTKQLNMALIFPVWIPCVPAKLSLRGSSMHSRHMRQMKSPFFYRNSAISCFVSLCFYGYNFALPN